MANKTSPKLTSRKAIEAALKNLKADDIVSVVFKPSTDHIWLYHDDAGAPNFGDAFQDCMWTCMVASIASGSVRVLKVDTAAEDTVPREDEVARFATCVRVKDPKSEAAMIVAPELIASLIVHPRPVRVDIDGLAYILVLNPDGSAKVGCQDITAKGCEQAFRAFAAHLGYDIEE